MDERRETPKSFEETYPRYPFSELVRLGLCLARWLAARRRKHGAARPGPKAGTPAEPARPPKSGTTPPLPGTLYAAEAWDRIGRWP